MVSSGFAVRAEDQQLDPSRVSDSLKAIFQVGSAETKQALNAKGGAAKKAAPAKKASAKKAPAKKKAAPAKAAPAPKAAAQTPASTPVAKANP